VKSNVLEGRRIAVCVGGGIAAYKACDLVRELLRKGAEVRVAMTEAAQRFVTPLTLQSLSGQRVLTDSFDVGPEEPFGHLHLSRWAEAFVVAPATADLLARLRAGMANDAVTTTLLAFPGPIVLAPAMNTAMWDNPVTQANLGALLAQPRIRTVGPGVGLLADGDVGAGRLADLGLLVEAIRGVFTSGSLAGKRVLITAGPTREAIDPVRFISNPSTGKMGLAVAAEARRLGAEVTVVLGPVSEAPVSGVTIVPVLAAVLERVDGADVFVASAAVSDFRPQVVSSVKVKKGEVPLELALERTPDVLLSASTRVHGRSRRPRLVGFAAETHDVLAYAKGKLDAKRLDFVVANDVSAPGAGFGSETNVVTVIGADGSQTALGGTKREVAAGLWALLLEKGLQKGGPS